MVKRTILRVLVAGRLWLALVRRRLANRRVSYAAVLIVLTTLGEYAGILGRHGFQLFVLGSAVPTALYAHAEERAARRRILRQIRRELRRRSRPEDKDQSD